MMQRTQQKASQSDIKGKINTSRRVYQKKHVHLAGYHARQDISSSLENMNDWDPII